MSAKPMFYLTMVDGWICLAMGLCASALCVIGSYEAAKVTLLLGAYQAGLAGLRNGSRSAGL